MSVKLEKLYQAIYPDFCVRLLTNSCFDKSIDWFHMIENREFIYLLHGGELIFNTSISTEPLELQINFINQIAAMNAHGLIVSCREENALSEAIIAYCNHIQFPIFFASWDTSYSKIMRRFSEILLDNERNETNLVAALKNAIYYPENEELYLNHFERNGLYDEASYVIAMIGPSRILPTDASYEFTDPRKFKSSLQLRFRQSILYEEKERFVLMTPEISLEELKKELKLVCHATPDVQIGIGSVVNQISLLHTSYKNALLAFQMCNKVSSENPLCYDDLGVFQILANTKDSEIIYPAFVQNTLGKLLVYDMENHTSYMQVLKDFFANNCSITQTAEATFFHQNTLKYKVKNIKEILGYDITANEHRLKIMLSLHMLELLEEVPQP